MLEQQGTRRASLRKNNGVQSWWKGEEDNKTRGINNAESYGAKKGKNLEPLKDNSFAVLHLDELAQLANDVNIAIGSDKDHRTMLINNMVMAEKSIHEEFVGNNPEVCLPSNLDVAIEHVPQVEVEIESICTPTSSFKESDNPVPWTEVVRRGRNKSKTRNNIENVCTHERCILEY
jgi:hypothetical protein